MKVKRSLTYFKVPRACPWVSTANYFEVESGGEYWISGPKKDGSDRLYGERVPIEIDEGAWHGGRP